MRYGDSVWPDGTPKVGAFVGLNPGTHGTTMFGTSALIEHVPPKADPLRFACRACQQFYPHSESMRRLNSATHYPGERFAGEIQRGVEYTMIASRYDEVVTPLPVSVPSAPGGTQHRPAERVPNRSV
ncbi:hypothetical protein [Gordonia crocea]|uniref:Uncharacterized protein n=1 Tax=Gordonia crocea TaxID=589162 RepID=A0A7I9V049_9ACTN|nr:hypothetical protein [Gordonia crocea]GED98523.1 hypothetical protein nbrc107697_25620 [Gordonia crocea]